MILIEAISSLKTKYYTMLGQKIAGKYSKFTIYWKDYNDHFKQYETAPSSPVDTNDEELNAKNYLKTTDPLTPFKILEDSNNIASKVEQSLNWTQIN